LYGDQTKDILTFPRLPILHYHFLFSLPMADPTSMNLLVLDLPTGQFPSPFNSVLIYPISLQGKIIVIFSLLSILANFGL